MDPAELWKTPEAAFPQLLGRRQQRRAHRPHRPGDEVCQEKTSTEEGGFLGDRGGGILGDR